jgi:hypothetical protein
LSSVIPCLSAAGPTSLAIIAKGQCARQPNRSSVGFHDVAVRLRDAFCRGGVPARQTICSARGCLCADVTPPRSKGQEVGCPMSRPQHDPRRRLQRSQGQGVGRLMRRRHPDLRRSRRRRRDSPPRRLRSPARCSVRPRDREKRPTPRGHSHQPDHLFCPGMPVG